MGKKKGGKKPASSEGPKPPETQPGPSRPHSEPARSEQEMSQFPALGEEGGRRGGRMRGRGRGSVEPPPEPGRGPPPGLSGIQVTSPLTEQAQSRESGSGSRGIGRGGRGGGRGGPGDSGEGPGGAAGHVGAGGEQGDQGAGGARDWRGGGRGGGGNGGAAGGGRGERGRGRGSQGPWGATQPPPPQQQPVFQPPPGLSRTPSVASVGAGDTPQQRPQQISSPTSAGRGKPVQTVPEKQVSVPQQPRQSQQQQQETELTKKVQKMTISQHLIPLRKARGESVGTRGKKIMLEVNHLALALKNVNMVAIHYDVAFKPDSPKRLFRLVMREFQKLHYPKNYPAFDGRKNLFSCGYLPGGSVISGSVKVYSEEDGKEKEFEVTIKFAAKVDMSPLIKYMNQGSSTSPPQEALQAIDIVLRNPAALRFVAVGRSFFTAPRDGRTTIDLGDGLELWYGFYQSAILGWKPYLNVDVAHKGFPKPDNLIKVILDQTQLSDRDLCRELDVRQKEALSRFIVGLKIEYELPGMSTTKRTYKVNRVLQCSVKERFMFEKDGQKSQISVGEYYEKHKNYRLTFPYMPCLHVGPNQKNIYVPVELCRIAKGQALMKKLNEKQTAAMVRNAAQPADVRKRRILDAIRMANFNSDPCVREFGISVNDHFTPVTGRILEAPLLRYEKQEVKPVKGVWRSSTFLSGQSLGNWCILNLENRTRDDSLLKFAKDMAKIGRDLGVNINPNPRMAAIRKRPFDIKKDDISRELTYCKNDKAELVVVVIPDAGDTYGKVKQAAELEVGILTQCVKSKTIFRLSPATVSNILLKVNSKLNGINHTIGGNKPMVLKRPIMIVGADVTHPSPDQTQIPSVAAVAASHDPKAFQYNMLWRLQPPRVEIIEDLENIMKEQLMFFYKRTNFKPERIFFYRDGVSEGQFSQVLDQELQAIRRACSAVQADYKPNITFLVVQKRHHTRFFPTRTEDEDGKNKNVPAGTIVDTTITHPTEFDFYLVSHASIQGTSRPTKYHLLWDDNDMIEDDLEELTYYLCHLFSRCTRSVSYPAPTYYAHLAAFRARVYLEGQRINLNKLSFEEKQREIKSTICKDSPMFFV